MDGYNVFVDGYPNKTAYFEKYEEMREYVKILKAEGFRAIVSMSVMDVFMVIMKERMY